MAAPQSKKQQQQNPRRDTFDTRDHIPVYLLNLIYNQRILKAVADRTYRHSHLRVLIEAASLEVYAQQVERFGFTNPVTLATNVCNLVAELQTGVAKNNGKYDFYTYVYKFIYNRLIVENQFTHVDEMVDLVKISLAANDIPVDAKDTSVKVDISASFADKLYEVVEQLKYQNKIRATVQHFTRQIHRERFLFSEIPFQEPAKKPKKHKPKAAAVVEQPIEVNTPVVNDDVAA